MTGVLPAGFPHSEISGSTDICSSPKLIAACHVLLRLLMPRHSPCALYSLTFRRCGLHILRCNASVSAHPFRHISSSRHKSLRWFVPRGDGGTLFRPSRLRLRDLVLLNYAGNQQVTSQNCNCYPHLFRCSTIKYHKLLSTFVERPLCCLAFHHILRCSVFKVQCRQHKLRITRRAASGTSHSLRCVSSSRHKRFRWFVPRVRA